MVRMPHAILLAAQVKEKVSFTKKWFSGRRFVHCLLCLLRFRKLGDHDGLNHQGETITVIASFHMFLATKGDEH